MAEFLEYLDWIHWTSAEDKVICADLQLKPNEGKDELSDKFAKLAIELSGLNSLPDTWKVPNTEMDGFDFIFAFLKSDRPEIRLAINGHGIIAISIKMDPKFDTITEELARRFDNYAVVIAHTVKRCLGERIESRALNVSNSEAVYQVASSDPVPVAIADCWPSNSNSGKLTDFGSMPTEDKRAERLLDPTILAKCRVREFANSEARATTPVALVALSRRMLRIRDRLSAAIDKHAESYRQAKRSATFGSNLAVSIVLTVGLFLGAVFSQSLFKMSFFEYFRLEPIPVISAELFVLLLLSSSLCILAIWTHNSVREGAFFQHRHNKAKGLHISVAVMSLVLLLLFLLFHFGSRPEPESIEGYAELLLPALATVLLCIVACFGIQMAFPYLSMDADIENSHRSRQAFWLRVLTGLFAFALGATAPRLLALMVSGESISGTPGTSFRDAVLSENEAAIFGFFLLLVVLFVFFVTSRFQNTAEKQHQLSANGTNNVSTVDALQIDPLLEEARDHTLVALILGPAAILTFSFILYGLELFPCGVPENKDLEGCQNKLPGGNAVFYSGLLKKIGWALPVLSFGILAQLWNRFSESGALTMIHDVTLTRLNRLAALINSEEEFVDRIRSTSSPLKEIAPLPNMKREAEKLKPQIEMITAMKQAVQSDFLKRSALVAASLLAVLQVPALRELKPDENSKDSKASITAEDERVVTAQVELRFVDNNGLSVGAPSVVEDGGVQKLFVPPQQLKIVTQGNDRVLNFVDSDGEDGQVNNLAKLEVLVPDQHVNLEVTAGSDTNSLKMSEVGNGSLALQLPSPKILVTGAELQESAISDGGLINVVPDPLNAEIRIVDQYGKPQTLDVAHESSATLNVQVKPTDLHVWQGSSKAVVEVGPENEADLVIAIPEAPAPQINFMLHPTMDGEKQTNLETVQLKSNRSSSEPLDVGIQIAVTNETRSDLGPYLVFWNPHSERTEDGSSSQNAVLLPLFPKPVLANSPRAAFNEGRNTLSDPSFELAPNSSSDEQEDTITLLQHLGKPFECIKDDPDASIIVDVLGFASHSWDAEKDSNAAKSNNHALAEGRRIALLGWLRETEKEIIDGSSRIIVVGQNGKLQNLADLLEEAGKKNSFDFLKDFNRFEDFGSMIAERDKWMSKTDVDGENPFEELFARSALLQVVSAEGETCKF